MNLVGKIFTVLIFLMCVVFGTFALMVHAAHKNWKEEVVKLSDKLIAVNKERDEAKEEKKSLQAARDEERARIQKRLIALTQAIKAAEEERRRTSSKSRNTMARQPG